MTLILINESENFAPNVFHAIGESLIDIYATLLN